MIYSLLSGALVALSMPGLPFHILVWFSLIPLFEELSGSKPLSGGLKGFVFFSTAFLISHFWILSTMTTNFPKFAGFSPSAGFLAFVLLVVYQGIFYFPFGFFGSLLSKKNPYLVYPALYAFAEFLRKSGQMGFTGARLSDALFSEPHLVIVSSVVGDIGLSMIIVAVNVFIWNLLKRRELCKVLVVLLLIYLPWQFFPDNFRNPSEDKMMSVYIYQTNEKPEEKYSENVKERLKKLPKTDNLLITPEAYITTFLKRPVHLDYPVLLGTLYFDGYNRYNSALLIANGETDQRYDKVRLFPFVEFLPYPKIFGFLKFLKGFAYYTPGKRYHLLDYKGKKIGVLICFESYFDDGAVEYSKGSDFIVVMTNDVWFKYKMALWNHFAKSVFRATESGRWVVQVANKGITGVVDSFGRIRFTLKIGKEELKKTWVGKPHPTIYPKIRNFLILIPIALLILGIFSDYQEPYLSNRSVYSRFRQRPFL